jgi:glutamyl-tRNA synthetase
VANDLEGPVRVRFAPSPTGFLHVGGARTAIYNDLLRQKLGGAFVLRIEDTDKARSDEAMTRQIQSALAWVGVEWDEGPFLQSARVDRHRGRAAELLEQGLAYRCFCTPELLEEQRRAAEKRGVAFRYPRTCLALPPDEVERRVAAGEPFAVRFRMPDEAIRFTDLVRGDVEFPPEALDDFILLRSDGSPTYHMSVVCDDVDMAVTHVIRGEDHLTNTGKHIPLFRGFGAPVPAFGHLPLILGPDKKRLSKRTGATSVEEFRAQGILPEALYNYLALLGWSPGDDREILSREEMEKEFSLDRVGASPSVFDPEKLLWMNAQYMARLPAEELLARSSPYAPAGLPDHAAALRAIELHRTRARTPIEMGRALSTYAADPAEYDADGLRKQVKPETAGQLASLIGRWEKEPDWTVENLERGLREMAESLGVGAAKLIHPTRLALTGVTVGAPLFDVAAVLGKETALRRLRRFAERIAPPTAPSEVDRG